MGEYEKRLFLGGPECGHWRLVDKSSDSYIVPVMKELSAADFVVRDYSPSSAYETPYTEHIYRRMPMKLWPEAVPIMYHSSLIESGDQGQAFMRWLNALYHKALEEG